MKARYAGNRKKRRTVIYPQRRPNVEEKEFRDNLNLLANILASYETAAATHARVLRSPDDTQKEVRPARR